MAEFDGKVALITGATRGIGLSIARCLVASGARVCVTARREEGVAAAVAELGGPGHALGVHGKADDPEHQEDTVQQVIEKFGRIDFLVNNAGINPVHGPLLELDLAAARKLTEVNVFGALGWTRAVHEAWMGGHGGAIVNVSSVSGVRPAVGIGMYGASKAMLISITETLSLELSPRVRVNAVAPALVRTSMAETLFAGREEEVVRGYPLGRIGAPDDVAGAVAFLLSDRADWITGQTLVIDGGRSLSAGSR